MRKVRILIYNYNNEDEIERIPTNKCGLFHQWGIDFEELGDAGVGNYTTAVVELEDGTIETPPANQIQFMD